MRIRRQKVEGRTHYTYPDSYDPQKVKYGPIYEGGLPGVVQSDVLPRNADDEYIVIGVDEANFDKFMEANNNEKDGFVYQAIEVNRDETLFMGAKWTGPQVEKITDSNKVISILAKLARNEGLTIEETAAIDPEDSSPGITKTKSFEQSLDEALADNKINIPLDI